MVQNKNELYDSYSRYNSDLWHAVGQAISNNNELGTWFKKREVENSKELDSAQKDLNLALVNMLENVANGEDISTSILEVDAQKQKLDNLSDEINNPYLLFGEGFNIFNRNIMPYSEYSQQWFLDEIAEESEE